MTSQREGSSPSWRTRSRARIVSLPVVVSPRSPARLTAANPSLTLALSRLPPPLFHEITHPLRGVIKSLRQPRAALGALGGLKRRRGRFEGARGNSGNLALRSQVLDRAVIVIRLCDINGEPRRAHSSALYSPTNSTPLL